MPLQNYDPQGINSINHMLHQINKLLVLVDKVLVSNKHLEASKKALIEEVKRLRGREGWPFSLDKASSLGSILPRKSCS